MFSETAGPIKSWNDILNVIDVSKFFTDSSNLFPSINVLDWGSDPSTVNLLVEEVTKSFAFSIGIRL